MPPAGLNNADRAKAHYRWAERYNDNGDHKRAAAHFGRALEYNRRNRNGASSAKGHGQKFGVDDKLTRHMANAGLVAGVTAAAAGAAAMPYVTDVVTRAYSRPGTDLQRFGAPPKGARFKDTKATKLEWGWYVAKLDGVPVAITLHEEDDVHMMLAEHKEKINGATGFIRIKVVRVGSDAGSDAKHLRMLDPLTLHPYDGFKEDMETLHTAVLKAGDLRVACVVMHGSDPGTQMRLTEAAVAFLKTKRLITGKSLVVVRAYDHDELRDKLEEGNYKPLGYYMMVRKASEL